MASTEHVSLDGRNAGTLSQPLNQSNQSEIEKLIFLVLFHSILGQFSIIYPVPSHAT